MRRSEQALITGAVLPVWRFVENIKRDAKNPLRVVRAVTDGGQTFVGLHIESEKLLNKIVGAVQALDAGEAYEESEDEPMAGGSDEEDPEEEE